jgi:CTP:molybdopterin cytidylyltransferase MocA
VTVPEAGTLSRAFLSVVIPAAGDSQRLGQAKQLVEHNGKPLIQISVDNACSVAPDEIIVVTGSRADEVKAAVHHTAVHWVHYPDWAGGMGGSIACGAAAASAQADGLVIILCDQWHINAQDLQKLAATWRSNPERIVVAEADGILMPPVIFPASFLSRLKALEGDRGARSLIKARPDLITSVPMENAAFDLDTESQLASLL